jgi:predicted AAA+ superfamily ATPase
MRRKAEDYLNKWFASTRRKPLIIRGARQVGKSTLVRNFCHENNLILHEINLEKNLLLADVFSRNNTQEIIRELQLTEGKGPLSQEKSVLFLDEIQAVPAAIPALRYFHEERPDIPVIAAGSLLEFALSKANFSMPVGRIEYLYLGPMSFQEFLLAANETTLLEYLHTYELKMPPSPAAHEKLLSRLREYLLVGGMPEAVGAFILSNSFESAFKVHDSILETYRDDFSKYASQEQLIRLHKAFDWVPSAVGEKFKATRIDAHEKSLHMRTAVDLLIRAGIVLPVTHSSCSGLPLTAGADERIFKPLFLDVGLMNGVRGVRDLPYARLMSAQFINEGKMAEQFAGQHLLYREALGRKPTIHYWLREERAGGAEVDYVISSGESIVPIEVKAGSSGSIKSLIQFAAQKKCPLTVRFDQNQPSCGRISHAIKSGNGSAHAEFIFLSLPLYMVEETGMLVKTALTGKY